MSNATKAAPAVRTALDTIAAGQPAPNFDQMIQQQNALKAQAEQERVAALPRTQFLEGDAIDIATLGLEISSARPFSSGSVGWNWSCKLRVAGRDCQVGINITAVHSKDKWTPAQREAFLATAGNITPPAVLALPREFSSGKVGWNANEKRLIGGVNCQVGCNIVVIKSEAWSR